MRASSPVERWSQWSVGGLLGVISSEKRSTYAVTTMGLVDNEPSKRTLHEEVIFRYRSPAWLINRIYCFRASWASCGWDVRTRVYNVVRKDSKVFWCASQDDVQGLQELFNRREATPFDCDKNGFTPLHVCITDDFRGRFVETDFQKAAFTHSYNVSKLLLENGADADCSDNSSW